MNNIWIVLQSNIETISSLSPEEYPELCRLRQKTTVLLHLYAIMQRMQTYSAPLWPAGHPSFFLFSIRHLVKWGNRNGYPGGIETWQSHKVFLLHAGLIKTHPVIGEQEDPLLQSIWISAAKKKQRSETLWTVPFYTPELLQHAEQIAREYREKHICLAKITKDTIASAWDQPTANSLFRTSGHVISTAKKRVKENLIRTMYNMIDQKGYTTEAEMRSECLNLCYEDIELDISECRSLIEKLMAQKRSLINDAGCEYHRIRKIDRKLSFPKDHKGYIITRK